MTIYTIGLYLMAAFYAFAGISHFRNPKFFLKITPPFIPYPEVVNIIIGVVEVLLAILLVIPATRSIGAWGVIILLILVYPANIYHHIKARRKGKHVTGTLIRLPIQFLLIYLAYLYV